MLACAGAPGPGGGFRFWNWHSQAALARSRPRCRPPCSMAGSEGQRSGSRSPRGRPGRSPA
eukprot:11905028-Alexandrium_andersonii.AAC.1